MTIENLQVGISELKLRQTAAFQIFHLCSTSFQKACALLRLETMELPGHSTGLLLLMVLVSLVVTMSESYRNHRSGDTRSLNEYWSCCQVGPKWISNPLFIITKQKITSGNQLPQYSRIPLDIHQHVKCLEMSYFSTIYIMPLSAFVQILLK